MFAVLYAKTIEAEYQKLIDNSTDVNERELLKREQWGVTTLFTVPDKRVSPGEFITVCEMINKDLIMTKVYLDEIGIVKVELKSKKSD